MDTSNGNNYNPDDDDNNPRCFANPLVLTDTSLKCFLTDCTPNTNRFTTHSGIAVVIVAVVVTIKDTNQTRCAFLGSYGYGC